LQFFLEENETILASELRKLDQMKLKTDFSLAFIYEK
jgi:hypothetical protein